ncbi:hypothetical protein D9M72_594020 [compost metagenome]
MQSGAGIGQVEAARATVDELLPDGLFEPLERHADGWLLQQQPVGRRGYAAFLHHHDKGAQKVPVEIVGEAFQTVIGHGGGLRWTSIKSMAFRRACGWSAQQFIL